MDNPVFVDEKTIEMVHQDDDYDEYRMPDTSRKDDETSFIDTTEPTSTLRLRQKVKRDKNYRIMQILKRNGQRRLN